MSKDSIEEKGIRIWIFISIAVGLFIISLGTYIYNFYEQSISKSSADWGTFGDFMGGTLNPMLAFLSFIALLYTIKLQSKELSLSRKELAETRKATQDSADALKAQSESIKLQNFENTFFNMLDLHNKIVDSLTIEEGLTIQNNRLKKKVNSSTSSQVLKGREAIKEIYSKIDIFCKYSNGSRKFNKYYDATHDVYQSYIGHYFGNIYQILKLISESKEIKDKKKYSNLFRAQFSSEELKLLFYHCTGKIGSVKFKSLIEEFQFFEHLVIEEINTNFSFIIRTSIYDLNAFGENKEVINSYKEKEDKGQENRINHLLEYENKHPMDLDTINQLLKHFFEKKDIEKLKEYIQKAEKIIKKDDKVIHPNYTNFYSSIKGEIEEEFPEIKPSSPKLQ
ncbi:MAG: putative phage abortive infection protein [Sphaerochaetaceae bacterium]|nr:putative phage abortive infection protein [Sphaerochaetaceae bacterium]